TTGAVTSSVGICIEKVPRISATCTGSGAAASGVGSPPDPEGDSLSGRSPASGLSGPGVISAGAGPGSTAVAPLPECSVALLVSSSASEPHPTRAATRASPGSTRASPRTTRFRVPEAGSAVMHDPAARQRCSTECEHGSETDEQPDQATR